MPQFQQPSSNRSSIYLPPNMLFSRLTLISLAVFFASTTALTLPEAREEAQAQCNTGGDCCNSFCDSCCSGYFCLQPEQVGAVIFRGLGLSLTGHFRQLLPGVCTPNPEFGKWKASVAAAEAKAKAGHKSGGH
jgi:hypothetical protein